VCAVALVFLDLCIASFTVTPKRAETTPLFEVHSNDVYLFIKNDQVHPDSWDEFVANLPTFKTIITPSGFSKMSIEKHSQELKQKQSPSNRDLIRYRSRVVRQMQEPFVFSNHNFVKS